jgi:hypothetical protein
MCEPARDQSTKGGRYQEDLVGLELLAETHTYVVESRARIVEL